jgi:Protein of unknown function (DUF3050)
MASTSVPICECWLCSVQKPSYQIFLSLLSAGDHVLPFQPGSLVASQVGVAGPPRYEYWMANERSEVVTHETARLERLRVRLTPLKNALLDHPIYREVNNLGALRLFMECHVFAVWDFMSLLKALQARLCCVSVPWLPASDAQATRFINEIVLAEESDEDGQGGFLSHFGLYLRSMTRCGADTSTIDNLLEEIRKGTSVPAAFAAVGVPSCVERFVRQTFDLIERGSLWSLASAFTFGREDLLPALFQRIVDELDVEADGGLEDFRYYLYRHIGLDGGEHGPMAVRLVASLCGNNEARWQEAEQAAMTALEARRNLWDAVHATLRRLKYGPV